VIAAHARNALTASAVVLAVVGEAATDPKPFGTVTTVQVERGRNVKTATLADVNLDGLDDLVLATFIRGKPFDRSIQVHLRRREGDAFVAAPDLSCEVPTDGVAFAVGDVHEDPGAEVVIFTASGAFAWRPKGPESSRFVKLVAGSFLWQLADPRDVFLWTGGVRDVDGDGRADVVLAESGGWRVALQRSKKDGSSDFAVVSAPRVPDRDPDDDEAPGSRRLSARAKRDEIRVTIALGGDDDEDGTPRELLGVSESAPAPQFVDFDGDGRTDLVAQTSRELLVWLQRADGAFGESPDARYALPVPADRDRRLDVSYSSLVADIDSDRRIDCVMLAGDKRSEDARTQVLVFVNGRSGAPDPNSPLFGAKGLPTQLLRIGGFAGSPSVVDVDGDGRRDFVVGAVRLDGAFDAVRAAGRGKLDVSLHVFRNNGKGFAERPDLTLDMAVKADGLRGSRREVIASFFADVTGDKVRDLVLRDEPDHLSVLMTRRSGDGMTIVEKPLWETHVDSGAKLVLRDAARSGSPEFLVVEDAQVLHVRFP
jgi:hypothetical protein